MDKVVIKDINDLLSEMDDELWLEMLNEFVDMQYVNDMIIDSFYDRPKKEQKEILKEWGQRVNNRLEKENKND